MNPTRQAVWNKTGGHCAYCGLVLTPDSQRTISSGGKYQSWMQIDHFEPKSQGGLDVLDNMVPACRACNGSKGKKSLEEYRHNISIRKSGRPTLTRDVIEWLQENGFKFPELPEHIFWFEERPNLRIVGGLAA